MEAPPVREPPYFDEVLDTWFLSVADYAGITTDDLLTHCRVVVDPQGELIGVQISDEIPLDHILLQRGLKRADIVKYINGVRVTTVSAARRTVREQYNSGVIKFEVKIERDGVEMVLRCIVPKPTK